MKLVYGCIAAFAILTVAWWFNRESDESVQPSASVVIPAPGSAPVSEARNFNIDDVISGLPESDTSDCALELGEFVPAPDVWVPHVEGAMGSYDGEYFLISGFSHYLQKHLLTSPRVDRRPRGQEHWVSVSQQAPVNSSHIQAAVDGPLLWIAGGFVGDSPGTVTDAVWQYNMRDDVWSSGPKLPLSRASGAFVHHAGELHYISGVQDRTTLLNEHISLNSDNPVDRKEEWKFVAEFPRPRHHFQAVSLAGYIYAVGGMTGHEIGRKDLAYVDVYVPKYKQWLPVADLPESRSHAELATFVYKDRIIAVGGRSEANIRASLPSVAAYNPYKNEWRQIGSMPMGVYGGFGFVDSGRLYVGGGAKIWKELSTKSWSAPIELVCK